MAMSPEPANLETTMSAERFDCCPYCSTRLEWNPDTDCYLGADMVIGMVHGRRVALTVCPKCEGTVSVNVLDKVGDTVFLPPSDAWIEKHGY